MKENKSKTKFITMIMTTVILGVFAIVPMVSANGSDYFVYSELDTGVSGSYGVDGYGGADGVDRIIFYSDDWTSGSATAYIYTVTIPEGDDPNMHPDNPDATGLVAPRTFTVENTFDLGVTPGHQSEFYVDAENNIIYLGASVGIRRYIYNDTLDNYVYDAQIAPPSPVVDWYSTQSLAYDPDNDMWYAGSIAWNNDPGVTLRDLWKYDGSQGNAGTWELAFQYTTPESDGSHHDGLEFINGHLWLADYLGDYIKQYTTGGSLVEVFWHEPLGHELEGMGFGALTHFWAGSHGSTISEFGGGALQIALEGIPGQCILAGDSFETFDLDDYAIGENLTWSYSGNVNLDVSIDENGVATITYPDGWTGIETITFTATAPNNTTASDDATFTVASVPVVGDIPDQVTPFVPFDLDDYLSGVVSGDVTWSASGMVNFVVSIDSGTHVATVTNPSESSDSETIDFTATALACGEEVSDSDEATFVPNRPPEVSEASPTTSCLWPPNHKFVDISIEGVTDPDGDEVTIAVTGITSDEPTASIKGAGGDKHAPDASGVGTDTASLRAERSGNSNGRVYEITFVASDGKGGETEGSVSVNVPHDRRNKTCESIDDGQNYDATAIN